MLGKISMTQNFLRCNWLTCSAITIPNLIFNRDESVSALLPASWPSPQIVLPNAPEVHKRVLTSVSVRKLWPLRISTHRCSGLRLQGFLRCILTNRLLFHVHVVNEERTQTGSSEGRIMFVDLHAASTSSGDWKPEASWKLVQVAVEMS